MGRASTGPAAFGVPVKILNDAAMQALGSDEGGRMLFLGLGSGLGTALVDDGRVVALELAHFPFKGQTLEDLLGQRGLAALGEEAWKAVVLEGAELLRAALAAEYVVLGGGNVRLFADLPKGIRRGSNDKAFEGGFRAWDQPEIADASDSPLKALSAFAPREHLRELFAKDPERADRFFLKVGDHLFIDYSKNLITQDSMTALFELARKTGVEALRDQMFAGAPINVTEQRAVMHVALAQPIEPADDGERPRRDAGGARGARSHARRSPRPSAAASGSATPACASPTSSTSASADRTWVPRWWRRRMTPYTHDGPRTHFVSNVDGAHLADTLRTLHPATTLFTIASKTFTTQETMTNARSAREWFLARAKDEAAIAKHFVAISTNEAEVRKFGIAPENMFVFWDWVGGRYSLWSSIGLPIAIAAGFGHFEQILDGAHEMDEHFRTAPLEQNAPIILGLLGVWYSSVLGADSHAVLPYEQHLQRLPAFLQQLEMESNGKRVDRAGRLVDVQTSPIVWGEPGTNGQHAFFQLLHQGTRLVSTDFLVGIESHDHDRRSSSAAGRQLHRADRSVDARQDGRGSARRNCGRMGMPGAEIERLAPHKVFPGNRPSTTIVYRKLGPRTLGMLLAIYEHRVFTMGAVWKINSFDQWGVELGKQLATRSPPTSPTPGRRRRTTARQMQLIRSRQGTATLSPGARASTGWMRVTRRAGSHDASAAVAMNRTAAPAIVHGSVALTP